MHRAGVWLADGKASNDFDDLAIDRVAKGPVECVELLEAAGVELASRNSSASTTRPLVIVVDEAAAIMLRVAGDTPRTLVNAKTVCLLLSDRLR